MSQQYNKWKALILSKANTRGTTAIITLSANGIQFSARDKL